MKILMYKWKAYNHEDLKQNLIGRGHEVTEITGELKTFEADEAFEEKLIKTIKCGSYDLMMSINYFPLISDICESAGLKYVSWCCDSPISTMYHESIFNGVNVVFTFDKINQLEFEDMGAPVYYLPLCGNEERSRKAINSAAPDGCRSEISFVGSMYNKSSYDEVYEHFTEYMKGYFDSALKLQTKVYGDYLLDDVLDGDMLAELEKCFRIEKSDRSFSDMSLMFSTTVLSYKIAQLERREVIGALSPHFDMDVYTDDESGFVRARNRGLADYWKETPVIFNRSRINLNLTLRSIRSGIPLRVWDIMAAGGFCISNRQAEMPLFFKENEDIVYFSDMEELVDKAGYYLKHDDERRKIASSAYEKVSRYHTYTDRIDEMAEYIPGM